MFPAWCRDIKPVGVYAWYVRYAEGGAWTRGVDGPRRVRMQAADLFERQVPAKEIAAVVRFLRDSERNATWHKLIMVLSC